MAIKMTKRGTPPQEQVYIGCCGSCRSEFECVRADLQHVCDPREPVTYSYIVCTVCGTRAYMELKLSGLSAGWG